MKIHLRERKLKNGRIRLYLDIYKGYVKKNGKTNAIREYEYLDLYLYQLVKGDIVGDINYHLKSKSLIGDHVKHLPYEKSASMYVSKYVCDTKTNWGIVNNNA